MVDPISTRGVTGSDLSVAPATRVPSTPAPTHLTQQDEPTSHIVQAASLASQLAGSAPVDLDRVARIKRAINTGNFPILPATIADRMLALKYDWSPHADLQEQQP